MLSVQFWQSYITKTAETAGHPGPPCYLLFPSDRIVEYQSLGPDPALARARDARAGALPKQAGPARDRRLCASYESV
jgi:hypothetical protein